MKLFIQYPWREVEIELSAAEEADVRLGFHILLSDYTQLINHGIEDAQESYGMVREMLESFEYGPGPLRIPDDALKHVIAGLFRQVAFLQVVTRDFGLVPSQGPEGSLGWTPMRRMSELLADLSDIDAGDYSSGRVKNPNV